MPDARKKMPDVLTRTSHVLKSATSKPNRTHVRLSDGYKRRWKLVSRSSVKRENDKRRSGRPRNSKNAGDERNKRRLARRRSSGNVQERKKRRRREALLLLRNAVKKTKDALYSVPSRQNRLRPTASLKSAWRNGNAQRSSAHYSSSRFWGSTGRAGTQHDNQMGSHDSRRTSGLDQAGSTLVDLSFRCAESTGGRSAESGKEGSSRAG